MKEKVSQLEEQMEKEIEVLVAPLRLEVASAKADLMKEKVSNLQASPTFKSRHSSLLLTYCSPNPIHPIHTFRPLEQKTA